tara:strand:- start:886 stop:1020 length:135 start_codon:yes stop_codon:yes gene_type:complete
MVGLTPWGDGPLAGGSGGKPVTPILQSLVGSVVRKNKHKLTGKK